MRRVRCFFCFFLHISRFRSESSSVDTPSPNARFFLAPVEDLDGSPEINGDEFPGDGDGLGDKTFRGPDFPGVTSIEFAVHLCKTGSGTLAARDARCEGFKEETDGGAIITFDDGGGVIMMPRVGLRFAVTTT